MSDADREEIKRIALLPLKDRLVSPEWVKHNFDTIGLDAVREMERLEREIEASAVRHGHTSGMVRSAHAVFGMACGDEPGLHAEVGFKFGKDQLMVTHINITDDLPGLHCNMERVRVWADEKLLFEGPLHNLEGVLYRHGETG